MHTPETPDVDSSQAQIIEKADSALAISSATHKQFMAALLQTPGLTRQDWSGYEELLKQAE
jgi:hypothetical protein